MRGDSRLQTKFLRQNKARIKSLFTELKNWLSTGNEQHTIVRAIHINKDIKRYQYYLFRMRGEDDLQFGATRSCCTHIYNVYHLQALIFLQVALFRPFSPSNKRKLEVCFYASMSRSQSVSTRSAGKSA